jgi:SAM-dependent methyltransferase
MAGEQPRLYTELAAWYFLLTAPEDYAEEEAIYREAFLAASTEPPRTLLELGCGAGAIASYYKRHFACTLTDRSPQMVELSRGLNPECEHHVADMRTLRLNRQFDVVFVHDAVTYLTAEDDLRQAIQTAYLHCRPGGVALFAPDHVAEIFKPTTDCGGHDGDGRSLRYLEWTSDPDPTDTVCDVEYAYLLQEDGQPVRVEHDHHVIGLFSRVTWLHLFTEAGFQPTVHPLVHSEVEPGTVEFFVCVKPIAG